VAVNELENFVQLLLSSDKRTVVVKESSRSAKLTRKKSFVLLEQKKAVPKVATVPGGGQRGEHSPRQEI
jgi:hypothetical protein